MFSLYPFILGYYKNFISVLIHQVPKLYPNFSSTIAFSKINCTKFVNEAMYCIIKYRIGPSERVIPNRHLRHVRIVLLIPVWHDHSKNNQL